jgi:rhodanese-related sulfurtransferase
VTDTVLDIRQDNEWDAGHLPGALHVELGDLADSTVPSAPITVMCGHGERAMSGASILTAAGHRNVSVLAGGPEDWRAATGIDLETA